MIWRLQDGKDKSGDQQPRRSRRGIKPSARINQVTSITDADEKLKALEAARLQIEKQFGQGSLMKRTAEL